MENRTIQERKEQFFQQMMLEKGKQISTCKKINLDTNQNSSPKNELKIDHVPKCKTQDCKTIEDNVGENLHDTQHGNVLLGVTSKR